ncbi:MAG: zf-HC2 domain-containing protein [Gemmatimonadota bacterium]
MTTHDGWTDQLSLYLDDELALDARRELESHLAGCAECRAVRADLERIKAWAPTYAGVEPGAGQWAAIRAAVERDREVAFPSVARRFSWREMVAAGIVMAGLGGGATWYLAGRTTRTMPVAAVPTSDAPVQVRTVSFADQQYDAAVAELVRTVNEGRSKLDSTTVRVVEESLRAIDRAIAEARLAIQRDPANAYLNGHVAANMRRKLELLRRTVRAIAAET